MLGVALTGSATRWAPGQGVGVAALVGASPEEPSSTNAAGRASQPRFAVMGTQRTVTAVRFGAVGTDYYRRGKTSVASRRPAPSIQFPKSKRKGVWAPHSEVFRPELVACAIPVPLAFGSLVHPIRGSTAVISGPSWSWRASNHVPNAGHIRNGRRCSRGKPCRRPSSAGTQVPMRPVRLTGRSRLCHR